MEIYLAYRNVFRNSGRFLLGTFIIGMTSLLLLFAAGQIGGVKQTLARGMTDSLTGHIQVKPRAAQRDFFDVSTGRRMELLGAEQLRSLLRRLRSLPAVEAAAPRLRFGALVGDGESSTPALVIAVDPDQDARVIADMAGELKKLKADIQAALVSPHLAEKTGIAVGGEILVLTETPSLVMNGRPYDVKDYLRSPVLIDEYLNTVIFTRLDRTRNMLYVDEVATDIAVRLKPEYAGHIGQAVADIEAVLDADERERLGVFSYREVARSVGSVGNIATGMAGIQIGAVMFVMLVIVLILTKMGLHERRREIGCLMSLGMTRGKLVRMFVSEVVIKVLIGFGLGFVIALALLLAVRHAGGIRATTLVEQYMNGGKIMIPVLDGGNMLLGLTVVVVATVLATAASCWSASGQDAAALLTAKE